jgi:hypothetical protein
MKPADVYKCMQMLPNVRSYFGGILPAHALMLLPDNISSQMICFIVLCKIKYNDLYSSHYIVLMWNKSRYVIVDPLHCYSISYDDHVTNFMYRTNCLLNYMDCQPAFCKHCSLYCMIFIYLKCTTKLSVHCVSKLLQKIKLSNNTHCISSFLKKSTFVVTD